MKIKVNKHYGDSFCNTLRQIALTQLPNIRPIGFSVGEMSTVVGISDNVEEDMTEFISNVSSGVFTTPTDCGQELISCVTAVDKVLSLADLCNSATGGVINLVKGDCDVLHSLNNTSVTVYFRVSSGYHSVQDNVNFLADNGILPGTCTVISSRHTNLTNLSCVVEAEDDTSKTFKMEAISADNRDGDSILIEALQIYKQAVQTLSELT